MSPTSNPKMKTTGVAALVVFFFVSDVDIVTFKKIHIGSVFTQR